MQLAEKIPTCSFLAVHYRCGICLEAIGSVYTQLELHRMSLGTNLQALRLLIALCTCTARFTLKASNPLLVRVLRCA